MIQGLGSGAVMARAYALAALSPWQAYAAMASAQGRDDAGTDGLLAGDGSGAARESARRRAARAGARRRRPVAAPADRSRWPRPPSTAALPRPARAAGASGPVAIIGGGIAGLTALWHLTQAGIDARLFEARTRLGGRMLTVRGEGRSRRSKSAASWSTPSMPTCTRCARRSASR